MSNRHNQADLAQRLVRYRDLIPCTTAFIDTRTPGNQKENFTIIGPGVAESPEQYVHINIPHGFNIGGVRQQPHCVNSQHSHETAEVFIIQNSEWAFRWGVDADEGEIVLGPGDVISIPTQVFRGFENVGKGTGYMCSVLGGDDPGRVTWAPVVFEMAAAHGLILLENGQLVDTTKGETVPEGLSAMPVTSEAEINRMRHLTMQEMAGCVYVMSHARAKAKTVLTEHNACEEVPVIGPANPAEKIAAGKMNWQHGFHLRCLIMPPAGEIAAHARLEEEVIYVYQGELAIAWEQGQLSLKRGDVITLPKNLSRRLINASGKTTTAYIVRGGDRPAAPQWGD